MVRAIKVVLVGTVIGKEFLGKVTHFLDPKQEEGSGREELSIDRKETFRPKGLR